MKLKHVTLSTLIAACSAKLLSQQFTYGVIDNVSGTDTYLTSVSGQTIIGYYQNSGSANSTGFIYRNGAFTSLANSIGPGVSSGIVSLQPLGISGNTIVGGDLYTVGGSPGLGFIYNINSGTYTLMPQGFGGSGMKPTGISNGLIVGYAGQILPPGYIWRKHSFTFDGTTYSSALDYPDPLSLYEGIALSTQAQATNGSKIVGSYLISDYNPSGSNYAYHGFILSNGAWTTISAPGAFNTYAQGIDASNIVGYFNDIQGVHGYIYNGTSFATLDVPGAVETKATGISGDTIVGTYLDSNGRIHGFTTSLPVSEITTVISQTDPRVSGNRPLIFNRGTLTPTTSLTISAALSVVENSTGALDSTYGNIAVIGQSTIGSGSILHVNGSATSYTSFSGSINGPGLITIDGGRNFILGTNSTSGTNLNGGTLTVLSTLSLPLANNFASNGSFVLAAPNSGSSVFTQSFLLNGNGYESSGALILGSTTETGEVCLSGPVSLVGNSVIGVNGPAGSSRILSGAISAQAPGTQLTLETSQDATLLLSSAIGANVAYLTKTGAGTLVLETPSSFTGTLNILNGTTKLKGQNVLSGATALVQGGTLILPSSLNAGQTAVYTLNIYLGTGTNSLLDLGSNNASASMLLAGTITVTGTSSIIRSEAASGIQRITSPITSASGASSLTFDTLSGSVLSVEGTISESIGSIFKTGNGQLNVGGIFFGSINSNSGAVSFASSGRSSILGNTFTDTSVIIETAPGNVRLFDSQLSLSGNGPNGAALTIGSPGVTAVVNLSGTITLLNSSVIRVPTTSSTSINFGGQINSQGNYITMEIPSLCDATISNLITANRVMKNDTGLLSITGTANSDISVNAGTLKVNGLVNGAVTVSQGASLKGSGTINGNVLNAGIISPGNSPGILSINGSYTATTGSRYDAEIAGLGGAGAPNGHDSIVVSGLPGTYSIQSGAGLNVIKLNGFEPAKGDSFRIINAAGGITGAFSTFTSQFNQWVLFDKATGVIYGTGLSAGQTFSNYSPSLGQVIWQNSVNSMSNDPLNGYAGSFDSTTPWGNAALSILRGESLPGSADGSPFAALGFVNHAELRDDARSTFNTLQSRRFDRVAANRSAWEPYIQYSYLKASAGGNPTTFDLNSSGISVGMLCDIGAISTVGFCITSHDSSTTFGNNKGITKGSSFAFIAMASTMVDEISRKVYVDAGIQLGNSTHKTERTTFLGQQHSDIRSENFGAFVRIGTGIEISKSLSATTYVGLDFVHNKTPSFKETGDVTALTINIKPSNSMQLQLGTDIDWVIFQGSLKTRLSLGAEAFVEILNGNKFDISYSYSGSPSLLADGKLNSKTGLRVSPRVEFSRNSKSCYYLSATLEMASGNSQSSIDLGYKTKF